MGWSEPTWTIISCKGLICSREIICEYFSGASRGIGIGARIPHGKLPRLVPTPESRLRRCGPAFIAAYDIVNATNFTRRSKHSTAGIGTQDSGI